MARPVRNTLALDLPLEEAWKRFIQVNPAELPAASGQSVGSQKTKPKASQLKAAKAISPAKPTIAEPLSRSSPGASKRRSK